MQDLAHPPRDREQAPSPLGEAGSAKAWPGPRMTSLDANLVRYRRGIRGGHVESHFVKGNSPDGRRAIWLKHTLLEPTRAPQQALCEVWAIWFDRDVVSAPARIRAIKHSFPLASAILGSQPFRVVTPCAELRHGVARGALKDEAGQLSWDLRFACPERALLPYRSLGMYRGPFPRSKSLTPAPDTVLEGAVDVDGTRVDVTGYAACQGHNWGRGHAHGYAWAHCNALFAEGSSAPSPHTWLESLSGRIRVGPFLTPLMSSAAICVQGQLFRFDGVGAMLSRQVRVDARSYTATLRADGAELRFALTADPRSIAGLAYRDPDGGVLDCLNSKLAHAQVSLTARGRTWSFKSEQAALEVGTREGGHGVTITI